PEHGRGGDPGVSAEAGADPSRRARGRQLLRPHRVVDAVTALATEPHRVLEPEEAELRGALVELAREFSRALPLVHVRRDLLSHPPADRLAELRVLVGE